MFSAVGKKETKSVWHGCALAFETDVGDLTCELFPAGLDIVTRIYEQREEWMALFEPSTFFHKYK